MKAVNKTLINLYWGIGKEIYNQQQEKGWGKSIVEVLASEIKKTFHVFKDFRLEICCYFLENGHKRRNTSLHIYISPKI